MIEIGKKYNYLTVVEYVGKRLSGKRYYDFYLCLCDCSKKTVIRKDCFTRKNATFSCGCHRKLMCRYSALISAEKRWLGGNEAAKRILYAYYKANAERTNKKFELNQELFFKLTQRNCTYCGIPPVTEQKIYRSKVDRIYESFIYNGIDRLDSNIGYIPENVVTCCKDCNRAKMSLSVSDFKALIKRIYEYLKL